VIPSCMDMGRDCYLKNEAGTKLFLRKPIAEGKCRSKWNNTGTRARFWSAGLHLGGGGRGRGLARAKGLGKIGAIDMQWQKTAERLGGHCALLIKPVTVGVRKNQLVTLPSGGGGDHNQVIIGWEWGRVKWSVELNIA